MGDDDPEAVDMPCRRQDTWKHEPVPEGDGVMTDFFSHLLILPNTVQARDYQVSIATAAMSQNTLVILPTGLGKTVVALMVMVERLSAGRKVLLLAPTKPLCEQHHKYFSKVLPYTAIRLLTGELPPADRLREWNDAQIIIATPQSVENDLKNFVYGLENVSLLVIDEAHRAVGAYSYNFISANYTHSSLTPLILAMTASPGGDEEKVDAIKDTLFISKVLSRSEEDPDVKKYLHEKEIDHLYLDLPPELASCQKSFKTCITDRVKAVKDMGIKCPTNPGIRDLKMIKAEADRLIAEHDGHGYQVAGLHAEIMKLRHASLVTETQGLLPLRKYLAKIRGECSGEKPTKASIRIMSDPVVQMVCDWVDSAGDTEIHPKAKFLPNIVKNEISRNPNGKILIFASYRDMVTHIVSVLKSQGVSASSFVGQSKKDNSPGMNQKKQTETIERFTAGDIQVLVSTSVGEEGLDIPSVDLVIFYEPVPSEIRTIQRRGRTGRFSLGRVIILVTRDTTDELNMIVSRRKEQSMKTMDHSSRQGKIGIIG